MQNGRCEGGMARQWESTWIETKRLIYYSYVSPTENGWRGSHCSINWELVMRQKIIGLTEVLLWNQYKFCCFNWEFTNRDRAAFSRRSTKVHVGISN